MNNPAALGVDENDHVVMGFLDAELINAEMFNFMNGHLPVEALHLNFLCLFDQIPANIEEAGNIFDRSKAQECVYQYLPSIKGNYVLRDSF